MRIVVIGTGEFGVPALRALVRHGHQVRAVISQPDRPAGRGREVRPTPIRAAADELGLRHVQTEDINTLDKRLWSANVTRGDDGVLTLAGLGVDDLVAQVGTPVYAFDEADFRARARGFLAHGGCWLLHGYQHAYLRFLAVQHASQLVQMGSAGVTGLDR